MLRRIVTVTAVLAAAFALGCPTPPDQTTSPGGLPPVNTPGAQGTPGAQQAPGGQAPGGTASPPQGGQGGPPGGGAMSGPPSFKDIITGDTITITVNVKGASKGQVDFMTMGEGPKALHVEPFSGSGPITVTAPAMYDGEIYIAAMNYQNGTSIGVGDEFGTIDKPVKFEGKDLKVSIEIGTKASWFKDPADEPPPPNAGAGQPAGTPPQGAAGGPPPGGEGPPPNGDAPPPGGGDAPPPPPGGDAGAPPPGGNAGTPPK